MDKATLANLARLKLQKRNAAQVTGEAALQRAIDKLSPKQRAFFDSCADRRSAVTSRQAGKTHVCMLLLLAFAIRRPGSLSVFICPKRNSARKILWARLTRFCKDNGLAVEFNKSQLEAEFANGSVIALGGCKDMTAADDWRGLTINGIAVLDETSSYPDDILKYLLEDIIEPACLVSDAPIVCVSTPSLRAEGIFFDIAVTNETWDRHAWDLFSNPAIKAPQKLLDKKKAQHGWSDESPVLKREWRGLFCSDNDSAVWHLGDPNYIDELPHGPFTTILGVDLGSVNPTSWTVVGWRDNDPNLYVLYNDAKSGMDPTAVAERIRQLRETYQPTRIVMDCGALGKMIADEFRDRHHLPVEAANKLGKPAHIAAINSDVRRGFLKIDKSSALATQMRQLRWDSDHIGTKEDASCLNDRSDSFLYAAHLAKHYRAEVLAPRPKLTAEEHRAAEAAMMFDKAMQKVARRQAGDEDDEPQDLNDLLPDSPW